MDEKCSDKFRLEFDFHIILEIFYMPQICDMGQTAFSPPKEGVLRIFFALKNPAASAGFEPANLGTKGQHATSRPPKPTDGELPRRKHATYRTWRKFEIKTVHTPVS